MRNLKKILALVLALVMSFSVMTVSSAAFADQDKVSETYTEAVDVLSALNVFKGDTEGNFNPEKTITRAEVAAIIYRITTGDVEDEHFALYAGMNLFTDVAVDAWYAGYVNYCASTGFIKGYDGKFNPDAKVNGVQALAMILRAVGYDKNGEFTGTGWEARVKTTAAKAEVLGNLNKVNLGADATREVVAQILFNAINVPQVTYSILTNDYITYSGLLTNAAVQPNASLAEETFGLICIGQNGGVQITAVDRLAGTTTMGGYTVKNCNTSWELIGHDAHVWAFKTPKAGVVTAITEAYIESTTLYTSTAGYTVPQIVNNLRAVVLDTKLDVFYNGNKVAEMDENAILAKADNRGVKVDFICNDFGGKADVIVITEYTPASLTAIATDINHGTNGIWKGTYTFDHTLTDYVEFFVYDGELVKGQLYTYVEYNNGDYSDYYVSDVQYVTDKFVKLNRSVVDSMTNEKDSSFVVGENTYVKAYEADHYFAGKHVLEQKNLRKTVTVTLDQYGYILSSKIYTDPAQFLYIYENEETHKKLTEAVAVFLDGTVQNISIAALDDYYTYFDDSADENIAYNRLLAGKAYQYYVEDGIYYLYNTNAFVEYTATYTALKAQYGVYGVNKNTTLVEVRPHAYWYGADLGDLYVGHRGDAHIPSITAMTTLSLIDPDTGIVVAGFLVDGYNTSYTDYTDDFIVFNTGANHVEKTASGSYVYYLDVIKNGEYVEDYKMSATTYALIDTYGVGHYQFSKTGALTFTTFAEEWENVVWGAQTLKVGNKYFAYDELPFYVLNIGYGWADSYTMVDGKDLANVKAYLTYDAYGEVSGIYVIADTANVATADNAVESLYNTHYNNYGEAYTVLTHYYVADNKITVKAPAAAANLMNLVVAYEEAADNYMIAVADLEAWVEANSAAKAAVTLADLYAAVDAAKAELRAAEAELYAALPEGTLPPALLDACMSVMEYVAYVDNYAMMTVFAANAVVDEIAAEVEFDVNVTEVNAVYTVGEDTSIEAVVVAAVEAAANKAAAADKSLTEMLALGAVVKAEIVEGEFKVADGAYEILVNLTLDLNGAVKNIEKTITVNLTIK